MNGLQRGFTLIELMIVIAIIGILAAIAVPAYQDYTARAKVSEALSISEAVKLAIVDYAHENGGYPQGLDPLYDTLGLPEADDIEGDFVERIDVANDGTGTIVATFRDNMDNRLDEKLVTLVPTQPDASGILPAGAWNWSCGTNIEERFVPTQCRNELNMAPDGSVL